MFKNFDLLKQFKEKVFALLNKVISFVFYFIGIGFSKLLLLPFKRSFLENKFKEQSSWKKIIKPTNLERQY